MQHEDDKLVPERPPLNKNLVPSIKVNGIWGALGHPEAITVAGNACINDYWIPLPEGSIPEKLANLHSPDGSDFYSKQQEYLDHEFILAERRHFNLGAEAWQGDRGYTIPKMFSYTRLLAAENSANVIAVRDAPGNLFALKTFQRKRPYPQAVRQMGPIEEEIEILKRVDYIHSVKYMGSYSHEEEIGIVMEPVADCDLGKYLNAFKTQDQEKRRVLASFFGCLASGLEYLHDAANVRHKDIKPSNVLVKGDKVLFTDFGLSYYWGENGRSTTADELRKTWRYCAPEAAKEKEKHNSKTDIWSLGCVFLEMAAVLHGETRSSVLDRLCKNGSEYYYNCPDGIQEITGLLEKQKLSDCKVTLQWIERMLQKEANRRPEAKVLRNWVSASAASSTSLAFSGECCKKKASVLDATEEDWIEVELVWSNECDENWISHSFAQACNLQIEKHPGGATSTIDGRQLASRRYVLPEFYLVSHEGYSIDDVVFWVTSEEVSFDLLVGRSFEPEPVPGRDRHDSRAVE